MQAHTSNARVSRAPGTTLTLAVCDPESRSGAEGRGQLAFTPGRQCPSCLAQVAGRSPLWWQEGMDGRKQGSEVRGGMVSRVTGTQGTGGAGLPWSRDSEKTGSLKDHLWTGGQVGCMG